MYARAAKTVVVADGLYAAVGYCYWMQYRTYAVDLLALSLFVYSTIV